MTCILNGTGKATGITSASHFLCSLKVDTRSDTCCSLLVMITCTSELRANRLLQVSLWSTSPNLQPDLSGQTEPRTLVACVAEKIRATFTFYVDTCQTWQPRKTNNRIKPEQIILVNALQAPNIESWTCQEKLSDLGRIFKHLLRLKRDNWAIKSIAMQVQTSPFQGILSLIVLKDENRIIGR